MKENEMVQIANLMDRAMKGLNVKDEVLALNKNFPRIFYSFDK